MTFKLPPINQLGFGLHFCPVVTEAHYKKQWGPLEKKALAPLAMHPASKVLHYAQEIFEGLKVFKSPKGKLLIFRPEMNIKRMTYSAQMMAMPPFPEKVFLETLKDLSRSCMEWVPAEQGALYLRPTMIATSTALGVAPSEEYTFYVMASPVGGYFGSSDPKVASKISIWISDSHIRAVRGGLGSAKTGANYAASLRAVAQAKSLGHSNVLFLDALERKYLEELSGMNFFLVQNGILKTPPLGDTVLAGVTRDSIIELAKFLEIKFLEEPLDVNEIVKDIRSGLVTEAFACGTGASITAISELEYKGEKLKINGTQVGPVTQKLYSALLDIQYGRGPAEFSKWLVDCSS